MRLHLFGVACVLLLAGCSGYAPGRSAADFPAEIKTVKLERLAALAPPNRRPAPGDTTTASDDFARSADPSPETGTREVLAVFKAAMVEEFQRQGIRLLEEDAAAPDLKIRVMVDYTPELGYMIHRRILVDMYIASRDGVELRRERYADSNAFGVLSAIVQSRDDMTRVAARNLVGQAVAEFRKRLRTTEREPVHIAFD